jgi:hypothetical protein
MGRLSIAAAVLLFASVNAGAEVYKCTVNGKSVYSDTPCAANAQYVGSGADAVTERQKLEAKIVDLKNKKRVAELEHSQTLDQISVSKVADSYTADDRRKQAKCDAYKREAESAKRDLGTYKYHQGIINDAKDREKTNASKYRSECEVW